MSLFMVVCCIDCHCLCWFCSTTVGPLAAEAMNMSSLLAPFTIGVFLFGAATSAVPSGILFRRYGRFYGFLIGCICQIVGALVGFLAIALEEGFFLFVGCFMVGLGQGLGQFYRFAAVEISCGEMKSQAVTYVLSGGVLAAVAGPSIAQISAHLLGKEYSGSFLAMSFLGALNWLVLAGVNFPDSNVDDSDEENIEEYRYSHDSRGPDEGRLNQISTPTRSTSDIVKQPLFILSCSVATIAHTVMVMIMSNCALSMKDDYTLHKASFAMELHFLAMFLPGFFSGYLIKQYSAFAVSAIGAVLFAASAAVFAVGGNLWNYYTGMTLLGVAWNFSYSGATVMLTGCYTVRSCEVCTLPLSF
jgi:MFS family permease